MSAAPVEVEPSVATPATTSAAPGEPSAATPANLNVAPVEPSAATPATVSSGTSSTSSPGSSAVTKKPSILTHGIFNSWLCGAGYIYNREIKMCKAQKILKDLSYTTLTKLKPKPSGRSAGGIAAGTGNTNTGTQAQAAAAEKTSVETAEYTAE